MSRLGPWLTLAAVGVLGGTLLAVTMAQDTTTSTEASAPAAAGSTPATAPTTVQNTTAATPFPARADYIGSTPLASGATLTLAITVEDGKAIAYACDGVGIESWLDGPAETGALRLTGKNAATFDGAFDGSAVTGSLAIGDKQWTFTAAPVQAPAGLYVYEAGGVRQSWITDGAGRVTGVQRAADGTTAPAPALRPDGTATVAGAEVTATKVSGADHVG
ncbi:hypothetical protein BOX37_09220 [Nocardia mangyaensis]|uniref:Serine/threonine protein kinase n=1 Tax=Nocardia mangyaensis TaxID=2213200 RepID=A0A1J0VQ01_9NOCA|nr:hypothetical protein [Nocardia mangyaensis]APE34117.1 hypothetical protein BOX37_09220 [Nocardia mangyaensis]